MNIVTVSLGVLLLGIKFLPFLHIEHSNAVILENIVINISTVIIIKEVNILLSMFYEFHCRFIKFWFH